MTDFKIIDRVRKLFNLAEKAGTVEEAGTAAALAQKLIAEHALSEEQIRQARAMETGEKVDEPIVARITYVAAAGGKTPTWISILSNCIEQVNGCYGIMVWHDHGRRVASKTWGRASDVDLVEELLRVIAGQIDAMCDASPHRGRTAKNSFRLGAVSEVCMRLRRAAADRRRTLELEAAARDAGNSSATTVTALALRTLDARKDIARAECERSEGKIRKGRSARSNTDYAAYRDGQRAGATVNVTRTRAIA